ncbi:MAG: DNA-3-methyladenine glycosylase [Chlamydiales bacterium]|nr:DNA-3-methyladenine glycosylase [Chlamydiales bacterium]
MTDHALPQSYFYAADVLEVSQELIGKMLYTAIDGVVTGGIIVETEAYRAPDDRASHAYGNRRTDRNSVMFDEGGVAYVYLCYGIHNLFNIVTGPAGTPHAVLIRAIQPIIGIETMLQRRNKSTLNRAIAGGPGALSQALGITRDLNGEVLSGPVVWVTDHHYVNSQDIIASPRVGVDYAGQDALLPWRFRHKNSPWTSPAK